jgi:hypothetical protein
MSLFPVALRFPFTATKGPSLNHEKQPQIIIPPPPNFIVVTMHWGRQRSSVITGISVCNKAILWGKTCFDWLGLAPQWGPPMAAPLPSLVKPINYGLMNLFKLTDFLL